jgi:hypothetical protein
MCLGRTFIRFSIITNHISRTFSSVKFEDDLKGYWSIDRKQKKINQNLTCEISQIRITFNLSCEVAV